MIMIPTLIYSSLELHLSSFPNGNSLELPVFASSSLVYGLSCILFSQFVSTEGKRKKQCIIIGTFLTILTLALCGPTRQLGLPDRVEIVILGVMMQQVFIAIGFIPILNELNELAFTLFPQSPSQSITDLGSGVYTASLSLGDFSGPLIGGYLYQHIGFPDTCFSFLIGSLLVFFLYLTAGKGYQAFQPSSKDSPLLSPLNISIQTLTISIQEKQENTLKATESPL